MKFESEVLRKPALHIARPLLAIPKGSSRLKIALRNAANAIGNLKEGHLADFFRRINYKKGRPTAINATARKLAVIIWNMLAKGIPYKPPIQYLFLDEKRKLGLVKRIQKQITKFEIQPDQLIFATNCKTTKNI